MRRRGHLRRASARPAGLRRAPPKVAAFRAPALVVAVWTLIACAGRSSADPQVQSAATFCREVQSIRVSQEFERDVLRDRAPETAQLSIVPAGVGPHGTVTVMAVGPVLGSMDAENVETTRTCDANGVVVTATTTRSAEYGGGVQKNVLWRPRLEIILVPRPAGTVITTTWKMRLTTGAEVTRTDMPPYPEVRYPVTVTTRIRGGVIHYGATGGVANKTDQPADRNGTGGVKITSVHEITNYKGNGTSTTVDTAWPKIIVGATPSILWPPNGKLVTVTVSGTIRDEADGSGVNAGSTDFFVVDQYHRVQPTGSVTLAGDGSYSFTVQLEAACAERSNR